MNAGPAASRIRLKSPYQSCSPKLPHPKRNGARHASGAKATNNCTARKNVFARYDHERFIAAPETSTGTSSRFSKHRALVEARVPTTRVPTTYPAATQSVAVDARRPLTLTAASAVLTAFPPLAPDAANPLHALPAPPRALDVDSIVGGARRHARADAVADADARDVDRAVANDADAIVVTDADAAHLATLRMATAGGECGRDLVGAGLSPLEARTKRRASTHPSRQVLARASRRSHNLLQDYLNASLLSHASVSVASTGVDDVSLTADFFARR